MDNHSFINPDKKQTWDDTKQPDPPNEERSLEDVKSSGAVGEQLIQSPKFSVGSNHSDGNHVAQFQPKRLPLVEKPRRHGVWTPVTELVQSNQSQMYNPSSNLSQSETEPPQNGAAMIDHQGRFDIGRPLKCDSQIADIPVQDRSNILSHLQPSLVANRSLDHSLSTDNLSRKYITPTYMDNDYLGKPFTDLVKSSMIVRINVGGTVFHVKYSTLQRDPFVYGKMLEDAVWIPQTREYFFERDPEVFRFIHSYLRRGELHLPHGMCGPLVEKELDDWGIPLGLDIQRCCLGPVMESKSNLESLHKFEEKLEPEIIKPQCWIKSPSWQSFREKVWCVIDVAPGKALTSGPISNKYMSRSDLDHSESNYEPEQTFQSQETVDLDANQLEQPKTFYRLAARNMNGDRNFLNQLDTVNSVESGLIKPSSNITMDDHPQHRPRSAYWTAESSFYEGRSYLRWLRRLYLVYETLIVTSAVVVFMLSTISSFKEPIDISPLSTRDPYYVGNDTTFVTDANLRRRSVLALPFRWLVQMDIFFSIAITIDVLIRMICCPSLVAWITSVYTLIDILSLIPFYCEFIIYELIINRTFGLNAEWVTTLFKVKEYIIILKVFIVLRLFRVLRRHRGTRVLLYTIRTTIADVSIIVVLILEAALFFGAAIYFVDSNFPNIPQGFWWALITMSTVGYGDVVPSNTMGFAIAVTCIIMGTLLMSYTIPVLVNHFLLYYAHADQLYMVKQLHRNAKRKVRNRKMSRYLAKAIMNAKNLVNATITSAANRGPSNTIPGSSCDITSKKSNTKTNSSPTPE